MSEKHTYWYRIPDDCPDSFYRFETVWNIASECGYVIESAAEDFFNNRDGWEHSWPMEFTLHETENGPELARGEVELEHEPVFRANEYETNF